ncbi:hypothetical protein [Rhodococcus sovatensis]|jgi:hypothetical protein|uniref:Uncharacterized protein n=1 Tax=Rhodococcus sovatensis TaxID=1805840 RepID=A0ABZ2PMR9_9NOCA
MVTIDNSKWQQAKESSDNDIDDREKEFYDNLPSSWVIPGIATRDAELKINPVSEFLLPHDRYDSIFDFPDAEDNEADERRSAIEGDEDLLSGLSDLERSFVMHWAQLGSAEAAVSKLSLKFSDGGLEDFIEQISQKMEPILREKRLNL